MKFGWKGLIGVALLAAGCGGSRDLAELPPYPEAFQREWFAAQRDLAKGDPEAAYNTLLTCAMQEPEEAAIPFQLGKIDFEAERYDVALVHFNRALQLGLDDHWALDYRAMALVALGETKDAAADLSDLLGERRGDIDYALEWVDRCLDAGQLDLALHVCDTYEDLSAPDPEVTLARLSALSQHRSGDLLPALEAAVTHFPDVPEFSAYLGSYLMDTGQLGRAVDVLHQAAKRDPYNGRVQYELGHYYLERQNDKLTVEHFTRAFESNDVDLDEKVSVLNYYAQYLYSPTVSAPIRPLLAAAIAQHAGEPTLHLLAAEVALAEDDFAGARLHTLEATVVGPHLVQAWQQLVALDGVTEDWEALAADAEAALARFPMDAELLYHAGWAASELGEAARAVELLEEARMNLVVADPELKFQIHLLLGDALSRVDREAEAAELYGTLIEMDPQNATLWNNQAWYYAQAGVELDRALTAIERAVALAPGTAIFEDTFAWVQHVRGDHEEAVAWMERALASDPNGGSVGMWENAGDIYAAAGRPEDAERAWRTALEKGGDRERLLNKIAALS